MDEKDLEIEDIFAQLNTEKKRVNGKNKGNRTELNLCKLLTKQFGDEFSKAPGSGARTSQVAYLPEHAKKTLTGDICVPEGFRWVIECKGGYEDDVNFTNVLDKEAGIPRVNEWIEQTLKDSGYCGRLPIIFWKRNRKPWLSMLRTKDLEYKSTPSQCISRFEYRIRYRDWSWVNLDDLFEKTERSFWYESK